MQVRWPETYRIGGTPKLTQLRWPARTTKGARAASSDTKVSFQSPTSARFIFFGRGAPASVATAARTVSIERWSFTTYATPECERERGGKAKKGSRM